MILYNPSGFREKTQYKQKEGCEIMKGFVKRLSAILCLAVACSALFAAGACAAGFPERPVTIVVGFTAGSGTDLGARYLAQALEKELGVSVLIENVPGSGSWRAWNQVIYNSEPDGYTVGLVNHNFAMGHYNDKAPRKETLDDIKLLANQVVDPNTLAIRPDEKRFSDLASFIEYAKNNEIMITVQTIGITDGDSTCAEWFNKNYGTKIVQVPVNSAAEGRNMFLAGDVDVFFATVGDSYISHNDGSMKVICQFSKERSELLPDVPTMGELGFEPYVGFSVRGYFYPTTVPADVVEKMQNALMAAMENPEYKANVLKMGLTPMPLRGDDCKELLGSQLESRKVIWNVSAPAYKD